MFKRELNMFDRTSHTVIASTHTPTHTHMLNATFFGQFIANNATEFIVDCSTKPHGNVYISNLIFEYLLLCVVETIFSHFRLVLE